MLGYELKIESKFFFSSIFVCVWHAIFGSGFSLRNTYGTSKSYQVHGNQKLLLAQLTIEVHIWQFPNMGKLVVRKTGSGEHIKRLGTYIRKEHYYE